MSKKKPSDLSKMIQDVGKKEVPTPPTIQEVTRGEMKLGRKPDFPKDTPTKKTTITMQQSTYDAIRLALATTHKEYSSQNLLMDAAIRKFLNI